MKLFSKFFFISLLFFISNNVMAQNRAVGTATVSVTIVKPLNVQKKADLNFGEITQNSGEMMVSPKDKQAGSFILQGKPGSQVSVTLPQNITLQGKNGNTVKVISNGRTFNTKNDQKSSRLMVNSSDNVSLNRKDGRLYIWFGGKIDSNGAKKGVYQGAYTAMVAYVDQ